MQKGSDKSTAWGITLAMGQTGPIHGVNRREYPQKDSGSFLSIRRCLLTLFTMLASESSLTETRITIHSIFTSSIIVTRDVSTLIDILTINNNNKKHLFYHTHILKFIHPSFRSSVRLFIRSFVLSFVRSFVRSLIANKIKIFKLIKSAL